MRKNLSPTDHKPALKPFVLNERYLGLALAITLHAAAIWGLLQFDAVRQSLRDAAPIMVRWIDPPQTVTPPKPHPVAQKPQPTRLPQPQAIAPPILAMPQTPAATPAQHEIPVIPATAPAPITVAPATPIRTTAPIFNAAYLRNPPPVYPPQSKRRNEEGKVFLRVYVNAEGAAEKIELQTSSHWPRLDQAAQDTVRNWRFIPAKQGDQAVAAWVIVPINFAL